MFYYSDPLMKWSEVAQSCPTLCDPVDCSPPGSSVHGILQARILEWVAISFSRGSSRPRDQTRVSRIAGRCFNLWATRDPLICPCKEWLLKSKNLERIFYLLYHNSKIILVPTDLFQHFADFSEITFYYIALH